MSLLMFRSKRKKRESRREWQHVGLMAGYLSGRYFIGAKDLHYGYWREGVEPIPANLARAQDEYTKVLLQHIPVTAKRILDVGCGAGSVAEKLINRGHQVDCVSPCNFLNQQARHVLNESSRLYESRYEDFRPSGLYDLILFCESFQYIDMTTALELATGQLRSGGQLVICDFFRKEVKGESPIRGGYRLQEFQDNVAHFPLRLRTDLDITSQTAPTFTVIDRAFNEVLRPIWTEINGTVTRTHPLVSSCLRWLFRRRIDKLESKYFAGTRTAEMFEKFKSYRLMVFDRTLSEVPSTAA